MGESQSLIFDIAVLCGGLWGDQTADPSQVEESSS